MQPRKQQLSRRWAAAIGSAALLTAAAVPAAAEPLVATIAGNDCAGVFGASFTECRVPSIYDADATPIIAKFDTANGGSWEFNSLLFPSVTADDFVIVHAADGTGTFTYRPDAGEDPLITFFVAKGGNAFNLFANDGDANTGSFYTPTNNGGRSPGLSHISFYDTGNALTPLPAADLPEPGSLALFGLALAAAGLGRRRLRPRR